VANNPVMLIDPNGKEIWINEYDKGGNIINSFQYNPGSEYSGDSEFIASQVNTLNKAYSTENGNEVISFLHEDKDVTSITNKSSSIDNTKGYLGDKKGGGELFLGEDGANLESMAHELFHAYQNEKGQGGASIENEVEAYLFGTSVDLQYAFDNGGMTSSISGLGNESLPGEIYQKSFSKLSRSNSFDQKSFNNAVHSFKMGSLSNSGGIYNNYPLMNPSGSKNLIRNFFPLTK